MSPAEKAQLVTTWIRHNSSSRFGNPDGSPAEPNEETFWSFEKLDDLCRKNPHLCFECILAILHAPHDELVTSCLAAGPLEDLLVSFGSEMIAEVETQAALDPTFKFLLGGVWRNTISSEVWARLEACRATPW